MMPWTETKLKELFKSVPINLPPEYSSFIRSLNIKKMSSVSGDITAHNRKGKKFFLYDLEIRLKWEGELTEKNQRGEGTIVISDFTQQSDTNYELTVDVTDPTKETEKLKEAVKRLAPSVIQNILNTFVKELRALITDSPPATQSQSIGTNSVSTPSSTSTTSTSSSSVSSTISTTTATTTKVVSSPTALSTRTIEIEVQIETSPEALWETFMDTARVCAFTGAPAQISREKGGKFSMFGGSVEGEQIDLTNGTKIEQKWRFKTWPSGHFSKVIMNFEPRGSSTILRLIQTDVPSNDWDRTYNGWEQFFWQRLKTVFGWDYKILK
jgi:activator of HSP90 ATPase